MTASDPSHRLSLVDVLSELRAELSEAVDRSAGQAWRFKVESIDVELAVTLGRTTTGKGGIKAWVVEAGAEYALNRETVHRLALRLTPVHDDGSGPSAEAYIGDVDPYG